ncbi:hypothetical protein [Streptomyces lateritius]|uniref:hypothetical protein n=1 Tax=Streptomyces lateritius TaxID=67313 RepID=UPI001C8CD35E|nr:hypothetical protein [Streptomyces lateritius]MBX9420889.1 hypothetical protein [Streptomyces lateritius]
MTPHGLPEVDDLSDPRRTASPAYPRPLLPCTFGSAPCRPPTALPSTPFAAFTETRPLASVPSLPAPEKLEVFPPAPPSSTEDPAQTAADAPAGEGEPSKTEDPGSTDTDTATTPRGPETEPEFGTREPPEPGDLHAPEVQVLGPVTVTGIASTGHGPKLAQIAA